MIGLSSTTTAARKSGSKKAARKSRRSPRRKTSARKRLTVRAEKRGLEGDEILLALGNAEVAPLDYFVQLVNDGAKERYGCPLPEEVRQRVDHEIDVIRRACALTDEAVAAVVGQGLVGRTEAFECGMLKQVIS